MELCGAQIHIIDDYVPPSKDQEFELLKSIRNRRAYSEADAGVHLTFSNILTTEGGDLLRVPTPEYDLLQYLNCFLTFKIFPL